MTEGDEDVNVDEEMYTLDRVIEESDCLDSSFLREGDGEDRLETAQLRRALDEANEIIRAMHCDLKNGNEWGDKAPIILVPGIGEMSKYNVQAPYILDGDKENCIGHWCDVSDSLIGPPDHGVRSPIVEAVLEAWTSDSTLHESLLTWLSDILSGDNIDSISPLTLHSLDCEVRDGFLLHVLPLLFLRPNLRLNVKTRIQRHSTYDVSVSVDHCNDDVQNPLSRVRSQLETTPAISGVGSAARHISSSNAMKDNADRSSLRVKTEIQDDVDGSTPIARGGASSRLSYDEMSEDITSSEDVPPGIMSALGGALGGFLNRRKGGVLASHETMPPHGPQGGMQTILESPASVGLAHEIVGLVAETDDDEQPYHRVVSAPPGRIGVTFVEYRGHCMLSDVYPDSPLIGWVFPSDVLIAIDDLPVSGMRVRDIIKVLKDRTSAQRALRVISSHAMNEFTMNASIVTDETG